LIAHTCTNQATVEGHISEESSRTYKAISQEQMKSATMVLQDVPFSTKRPTC
jgi:hypothetical protein